MTITIRLSSDEECRLSERASQNGQDVVEYIRRLIEKDIQTTATLDEILAPVRKQFEESGMSDDDLDALVDEVREEIWQERQARRNETS